MTSAFLALFVALAVGLASSAETFAAPSPSSKASGSKQTAPKAATVAALKLPSSASCFSLTGKSAFFGPFSMKVGRGFSVRAKCGFTIWSEDKSDEVYILNAENHVYFRESSKEWLTWNRRGVPPINITEVEMVDKATIAGQPCVHYFGYQMVRNEKVKVAEFYCLQKAPCDSKVLEFWCKHYLLPAKCGFPIIVKQRVDRNLSIILDTKTMQSIPASALSLQVPKDYREAKDKAGLYFSDAGGMNKSDLEEIFRQPLK